MAQPKIRNPFPAVSIEPETSDCCAAATAVAGQRSLVSDTPLLPLSDCDRRDQCKCRYLKWDDRRQDDRRGIDNWVTNQYFEGNDKRGRRRGRRRAD